MLYSFFLCLPNTLRARWRQVLFPLLTNRYSAHSVWTQGASWEPHLPLFHSISNNWGRKYTSLFILSSPLNYNYQQILWHSRMLGFTVAPMNLILKLFLVKVLTWSSRPVNPHMTPLETHPMLPRSQLHPTRSWVCLLRARQGQHVSCPMLAHKHSSKVLSSWRLPLSRLFSPWDWT